MGTERKRMPREARIARMDVEILDVTGAAELLGVSKKSVYGLIRKGVLPARKVGKEWRFARRNLINWVADGQGTAHAANDHALDMMLKNNPNVRLVK